MPPVTGVLETSLYVADLRRSAAFYRDLFGFEVLSADERFCGLNVAGRQVLVCGERREDVSVRLAYADVPHELHDSVEAAARAARLLEGDDLVDVVANYTAFRDLLRRLEPAGAVAPSRVEPVR